MLPSSGVNFMALDSRFSSTWFSRTLSQYRFSRRMFWINTSNSCRLAFTWGWMMLTMLSMVSRRQMTSTFSVSLPLSILDISRTSLIRPSRCWLDREIFRRQEATRSGLSILAAAMAVMPTMAFMGVRMSWLILERNSLLARLARSASRWAFSTAASWRRDMRRYRKNTTSVAASRIPHPASMVAARSLPRSDTTSSSAP